MRKDNTSGTEGVMYRKDRECWIAFIILGKRQIRKCFKSKEEAIEHRAYLLEKYAIFRTL